jgi:hypothetical protein
MLTPLAWRTRALSTVHHCINTIVANGGANSQPNNRNMNTQLTAACHFQARKPYSATTLNNMRQQKFQARINSGDDSMSEDISVYIPIVSRTDNQENLINEVIPQLTRLREGFGWTWATLYGRIPWCLDEAMANLWTIKDAIAQTNCNQANLKGAICNLMSQAINQEFPRDDIVEMLQSRMRKAADETPIEHYEHIMQLKKCADWTNGICSIPTDQECKTYLIRHIPQNLKESIRLRGLNQDSDVAQLKEALDQAASQN